MGQFLVHILGQVIPVCIHIGKHGISVFDGCRLGFFFGAVLQIGKIAGHDAAATLDADSPTLEVRAFVCVAGDVFVFHGSQGLVSLTLLVGDWFNNMQGE